MGSGAWGYRGSPQRRCRRRPGAEGYALPLAVLASLVMVGSSTSLVGTALVAREASAGDRQRTLLNDRLQAVAQLVVAQLQDSHRCLLPWSSSQWAQAAIGCGVNPGGLGLEALPAGWRLQTLQWQPSGSLGVLQLGLVAPGGQMGQRRFRLVLAADGQSVVQLAAGVA